MNTVDRIEGMVALLFREATNDEPSLALVKRDAAEALLVVLDVMAEGEPTRASRSSVR